MKQALLFLCVVPLTAQSTDTLNAALWMQTSAEYRASALQAWRSARQSLPHALKDKRWTAALEQRDADPKRLRRMPPAIIVDIDETVFDNSPTQKRFIEQNKGRFDSKLWSQWTAEARARAIPGAGEFLREAGGRGVTVFYVTNRNHEEEPATRRNLSEQGLEVRDLPNHQTLRDTLLTRGERPEWTSDKSSRRIAVAMHFRILMLCGDDLNDFLPARVAPAERSEKARLYEAWWGERWIILPNPAYGSWEDALLGFDRSLSVDEAHRRKLDALRSE